jgi:hypothetical protein
MLTLNGSSADAKREKAVMGVCRSEVKEEGFAQQNPGDMSGGMHPSPPSQNKRQPRNISQQTKQRRKTKWAK